MKSILPTLALYAGAATATLCGLTSLTSYPQWYCDVCGADYGCVTSAPYECQPYNATFDDVATGSISDYSASFWTGFEVTPAKSPLLVLPAVEPYTAPNYAKVNAGVTASIAFPISGFLYSLHFACSVPVLETPTACKISINSHCAATGGVVAAQATVELDYDPESLFSEAMAYADASVITAPLTFCSNYTFAAVNSFGIPVDLYLDNVILASYETVTV